MVLPASRTVKFSLKHIFVSPYMSTIPVKCTDKKHLIPIGMIPFDGFVRYFTLNFQGLKASYHNQNHNCKLKVEYAFWQYIDG